ncbi:hypothetical protein CC77DRAFT_1061347 [Alternaria alternata]|uniref:Uncharacterized protein n=2 Tax=Alternaria alternata complex TaxID=187734 RepID=A0A177DLU8_ALTAL|nr:hypothetical protein CC77DRAFT_1061347 [Alternaria alternata]OAG20773.1 hypothetical protein CC77DRAFT_1061347 [Alternaria alternata]RYN35488.1 hypothetical protein AA0115_g2296 [Alternaria tenuissima]
MENIIGHGKLGDDLCSGFEVQMILPGLAEFSHSQQECLFHKLCYELDQYYDNTLIEFYDRDSDYPSSDGSTSSEDGTEDYSDDDYWEQSELTEDEKFELGVELALCANEDLSIPPMHYC